MQTAATDSGRARPGWLVPLLVMAVAIPTFLAFWIGGLPQLGAVWAALSVAFGLLLAFGGRSDTIRLLRGDEDDERTLALEAQAMTITALVLTTALAGLFLAVESAARAASSTAYC